MVLMVGTVVHHHMLINHIALNANVLIRNIQQQLQLLQLLPEIVLLDGLEIIFVMMSVITLIIVLMEVIVVDPMQFLIIAQNVSAMKVSVLTMMFQGDSFLLLNKMWTRCFLTNNVKNVNFFFILRVY